MTPPGDREFDPLATDRRASPHGAESSPGGASASLRALFLQAPVAIVMTRGPAHVIELANPAMLRLVGRDASVLGLPLAEAFPELEGQVLAAGHTARSLCDAVLSTGEGFTATEVAVTLGGARRLNVTFNVEPVRDDGGAVTGVVAVCHDVTEQVLSRQRVERLTEAQRGLEGRLRMALAAAELGTWERDLRANTLTWDDTTKRTLGMSPDDETPESILPRVHPDDVARVKEAVARAHDPAGGGDYDVEFRVIDPDPAATRWCHARGKVYFEDGRPVRFLGVSQDTTRRRQAEAEALRERQRAEEANRAKDEFLAMLGHELRNPLAPILSALDVLRRRGEGNTREHAVIERHARHLVRLVDDLLDVARVMRGAVVLHRQRVPLKHVVARALELTGPLIEQRRQELSVEVPPMGLDVDVDPLRMVQVVSNLLTNAAKYTEVGGAIYVSARREPDGDVTLAVRDTGIGITPDALPRIFDPFVQEHQALDRAQGGLGIGLALVRSFVTLHGGAVTAQSEGRSRGSTFTVRLPAAALEPLTEHGAATSGRASATVTPLRVLVVDDNEDAGAMLAEALRMIGHQVWVAHDGAEALRVAADVEPAVALLDIGLPHMDGYELATHLHALPLARRPRLIAITGYGRESDRLRAFGAGFEGHFVKPVDVDALLAHVERLASRARE